MPHNMSQTSKIVLSVIITAIVAGGVVYFWQKQNSPVLPMPENKIIKYNCEQSGGRFTNNKCFCPLEEQLGQTSEMMYDKETGYCQTTHGGPGGRIGEMIIKFGY